MTNWGLNKIAAASLFFFTLACFSPDQTPQPSSTPTVLPASTSPVPSVVASPVLVPTPVTIAPVPSGEVLPLLIKPFVGDYALLNFFDHDIPIEFRDSNGYLITWWGEKTGGLDGHDGLDFILPSGTQILAAADGVVVRSGIADPFYCPPLRRVVNDSLGVEISHKLPDGTFYMTAYFHLSKSFVELNQAVLSGQVIGLSGDSGCSTQPHLHFMVDRFPAKNGKRVHVDPFGWSGDVQDPWDTHKDGSKSVWLWKQDKAPLIFREVTTPLRQTGSQKIQITLLRWMGWKDSENPNNEFVQLELALSSTDIDISGHTLKNLKGETFRLPEGSVMRSGVPFRIYSGAGVNAGNILYVNRPRGVWDNMADCAILQAPNGDTVHEVGYGGARCP